MNVRVDSCHKLFNMACLPWAEHGLLDFIHNPKVPPKISRYKKQSCMNSLCDKVGGGAKL